MLAQLHSLQVGNTPLIEVHFTYQGEDRKILAKLEFFNPTGSIKDRIAKYIVDKSYAEGLIKKGDQIVEASSGNTGIAFAAIGATYGHPVKIFMPEWMSEERKAIIRGFGAEIQLVTAAQNGFLGSIDMAEQCQQMNKNVFLPRQFDNAFNTDAHYHGIGQEILKQTDGKVDAFVAGVGTGGTVMGVNKALKECCPNCKVHPLEPANSPTLSTGGHKVGKHRIQGVSDEFIPSIVDLDQLDCIIQVDDGDAIIMAQQLACKLGLGVGISSGANFLGAIQAQNKIGSDAKVVTIFCDDNKKYLSTDLSRVEPVKDGFLSTDVVLKKVKCLMAEPKSVLKAST